MADFPLWQFSLAYYARPGVASACLMLQDECGVDVNVALFLLFLAAQNRVIDDDDMRRIVAVASPWHDAVVSPLRSVRRRMKSGSQGFGAIPTEALRDEVKRVELSAERLLQKALDTLGSEASFASGNASSLPAARANLVGYGRLLGIAEARFQPLLEHFHAYQSRDERG